MSAVCMLKRKGEGTWETRATRGCWVCGAKWGDGMARVDVDSRNELMDQRSWLVQVGDLLASTVGKMSLKFKTV